MPQDVDFRSEVLHHALQLNMLQEGSAGGVLAADAAMNMIVWRLSIPLGKIDQTSFMMALHASVNAVRLIRDSFIELTHDEGVTEIRRGMV